MEVLAGFLLGYLVGAESGAEGLSVVKDAFGNLAGSADVQSMLSSRWSSSQGVFGGSKDAVQALGSIASSGEVRGLVSIGFSTATGIVSDLVERGKELVSPLGGPSLVG